MNNQLSILTAAFQRHSPTSREAAVAVTPHVPSLQVRVLEFIKANGPVTDSAIIDGLELSPNSVRPRRIELMHAGMIAKGGTVTQPNGRKAETWVIAENFCRGERSAVNG